MFKLEIEKLLQSYPILISEIPKYILGTSIIRKNL